MLKNIFRSISRNKESSNNYFTILQIYEDLLNTEVSQVWGSQEEVGLLQNSIGTNLTDKFFYDNFNKKIYPKNAFLRQNAFIIFCKTSG